MIKNGVLFFLGLFCSLLYAQQDIVVENDSLILWQADRKLTWDDFKGEPKPVRVHNAAASGISFPYNFNYRKGQLPELDINCYFEKYIAWTIIDDKETLEHEQIHFDIAEWHTRKIRQCVEALNDDFVYDIEEYIAVVNKILSDCEEVHEKFDFEVLANYPRQLEWRAKIDAELEALKEYEYIGNVPNSVFLK